MRIELKLLIVILSIMSVLVVNQFQFSVSTQLISLVIFVILGIWYFKFEILHPFVWLSPFILIYYVSILVLDIFDIRSTNISSELIFSMLLALSTLFFYFAFFSKNLLNQSFKIKKDNSLSMKLLLGLFIVLLAIIILNLLVFLNSGITTKSEMSAAGGGMNLGHVYKFFLFVSTFIFLKKIANKESISKLFFIVFIVALLISLVLGERDILMTLILFAIYIYYISYKPAKKNIYILAIILILLLPVLGHMKNIFTKDTVGMFTEYNAILAIFQGEFLSAGRNFETILHTYGKWDYFYGETILWDLGRSIASGSIYYVQNSIGWFNNTFHPDIVAVGRGYGFSFIAEGYINFGYFGIVLWYLFLAILLNFFYQNSQKNSYWFVAYIYMIPIFIYIQRGDISNIISPMLKQTLLFTIVLIILNSFFKQLTRRKKIENINNNI